MPVEIPRQVSSVRLADAGGRPRRSLLTAGAGFDAAARGAQQIAGAAADFFETRDAARRSGQINAGTAAAVRALNDIELELEQSPEFAGAEDRFATARDRAKEEILGRYDDPAVRGAIEQRFTVMAEAKRVAVSRNAFGKEVNAGIADLDSALADYAADYGRARNDVEAGLYQSLARESIGRAVAAGYITPVNGGTRERKFLSDSNEAQVRELITHDPEAAFTALAGGEDFAYLDERSRARLMDTAARRADTQLRQRVAAAERAERDTERARRKQGDDMLKNALDRDAEGVLSQEEVQNLKPFVSPDQYRSALKLLEPVSATDDPAAYADLENMLTGDPAGARAAAFRYHGQGLLSNETLRSVSGRAEGLLSDNRPPPVYRRMKTLIADSLDPGPFVTDPNQRLRRAEAMAAFDRYVNSGDRTEKEMQSRAAEIVTQYRLVDFSQSLAVLPNPRFGAVRRNQSDTKGIAADVAEAEAETVRKYRAGEIDRAEFEEESRLLKRWHEVVSRGGGSERER